MRRRRAVVGPLLLLVGVVHVGLTPVLYPMAVQGVLGDGVLGAIEADPAQTAARALGFWYATTGIGLLAFGWAVTVVEHSFPPLPLALPLVLVGIGVWGVILLPASPFWVFPLLAVVAELRRRNGRCERRPAQ